MLKLIQFKIALLAILALVACGKTPNTAEASATKANAEQTAAKTSKSKPAKKASNKKFTTVEWVDLLPKDDLDALLNPPEYIDNIAEGSLDDQAKGQLENNKPLSKDATRYEQALSSKRIIKAMDGKNIRIPGFIVPLEFGEEKKITQFFLVPFFGACIHVPPPPPNQIIHVTYPKGFKLEALYQPFWISGKLKVELVENDMATSAYTMVMEEYELYTEEEESASQ